MNFKTPTELENDPDTIIYYWDEIHFMAESTVTRVWYPKGSYPKMVVLYGDQLHPVSVKGKSWNAILYKKRSSHTLFHRH